MRGELCIMGCDKPAHKPFKTYAPGFVHVDVKHLPQRLDETTRLRYVWLYNHHLPQKALGHRCPMDAMKQWYAERPDLFAKQPRNHPGSDT